MRQTGTPTQGLARLEAREAELDSAMAQVERLLARRDSHVRIEEDRLVLTPLEAAPRPASAEALADRITGLFARRLSCSAEHERGHLKFPIISSNGFATSFEGEEQRFSSSQCLA